MGELAQLARPMVVWTSLARIAESVGLLVIDESFGDATPEATLAPVLQEMPGNVIVLRSFGKFYGLAGVRLGFALGHGALVQDLAAQAGPWPVSGPAIEIAEAALRDRSWQRATIDRLEEDCARMDALALGRGWSLVGGCALFRTYEVVDAAAVQRALAERRIWSRVFPYSATWLRLGLPAPQEWDRVSAAISEV